MDGIDKGRERPKEQHITLHSSGVIPGIVGHHGPGDYLVNYAERTIRPVPPALQEVPEPEQGARAKPARGAKPPQGIEQAD